LKAALKDFRKFPEIVQDQAMFALRVAANGEKADTAKPLKGFGSGVFEIALRYCSNAFRTVYALQLNEDVRVLHAFQKKSRAGIKTPKQETDLIRARLRRVRSRLMSDEELDLMRGSDNPFRDVGLSDPDTKLMKADLAAGILRILRERGLSGAKAAELARVTEADISRIRNADLNRFTIDRLVKILNRLDRQIEVGVTMRPRREDAFEPSATQP
jgi:phage-related protein/predicted XRE-type DNA-binding protein